jgi:hypothetical protein
LVYNPVLLVNLQHLKLPAYLLRLSVSLINRDKLLLRLELSHGCLWLHTHELHIPLKLIIERVLLDAVSPFSVLHLQRSLLLELIKALLPGRVKLCELLLTEVFVFFDFGFLSMCSKYSLIFNNEGFKNTNACHHVSIVFIFLHRSK